MGYKRCTKCGESKPLDQFSRRRTSRDGRQYRCKACKSVMNAEWWETNGQRPDVQAANRARARAWHDENREDRNRRRRERRSQDEEWAERDRSRDRERYWNLSGVEYNYRLLRTRRYKALARIAAREERRSSA